MKYSIVFLLLWPMAASTAPQPSPALIEKGKTIFENSCVVCHGSGGKGDGPAAAGLNPKPRNLVSDPFKAGKSPDEMFKTLTAGLKGTNMPEFSSLPEDDRWSVIYFVLSLK